VHDKHALVSFRLTGIAAQEFEGWNHQNVLMSLDVSRVEEGFRLELEGTYGVDGYVIAQRISISLQAVPVAEIDQSLVARRARRKKAD
jgi:hypothetical protein